MRATLYEKKYFDNSALFATMVEESFAAAGRQSYGVKQRDVGIQVLQATGMPSVLIEVGFLTNKEEEEYLNSDKGQSEVVQNIVDALERYKNQVEGGISAPPLQSVGHDWQIKDSDQEQGMIFFLRFVMQRCWQRIF